MVGQLAHFIPVKVSTSLVARLAKIDNALFKHTELYHQGAMPEFEFQAERFFTDATSAQIYEGVAINNTPSDEGYLMNSKAEYQQGEVARVVVVRGLAE